MDMWMPPAPPPPPTSPPATGGSPPQAGPPPSPATSPLPLVLGAGAGAARRLAEELQAGLRPLLDPGAGEAGRGEAALQRPYARDECVHVFRVCSKRSGRTRSVVAWLRHTKHVQDNLLLAVRCNDAARVRLLVGMGADVNRPDPRTGQTPLQLAQTIGSTESAATLQELGASLSPPSPTLAPTTPTEDPAARRVHRRDLLETLLGPEALQRLCRQGPAEGGLVLPPGAAGGGLVLPPVWRLQRDERAERVGRRLLQAREVLRAVRRRRINSELGSVMDQMGSLNLRSGDPPRLDVHSEFSRLSLTSSGAEGNSARALTSGGEEANSSSAEQPQGATGGHL